jgi:hypothetical protein
VSWTTFAGHVVLYWGISDISDTKAKNKIHTRVATPTDEVGRRIMDTIS